MADITPDVRAAFERVVTDVVAIRPHVEALIKSYRRAIQMLDTVSPSPCPDDYGVEVWGPPGDALQSLIDTLQSAIEGKSRAA